MMNVLDVLPIGSKSKLVAVQIRDRVLIVGAGDADVRTLAEFDGEDFIAAAGEASDASAFRERLLRLVRK